MPRLSCWKVYIILILLSPDYSGATDFSQCLKDVINCATHPTGQNCTFNISNTTALSILRTSDGFPITDPSNLNSTNTATAISITGCTKYCGSGPAFSRWMTNFSQEFSAWLLPYLALLSQLPFGAPRRIDNLMAVILTLGSPTLAAYSLYITLLNTRWLNDHLFFGIDYPSAALRRSVVQVLSSLQQVPLRIHPGRSGRFESLVVHPANEQWWTTISEELNYSHTWSIANVTSVGWVVIAYLLTVVDSFSSLDKQNSSNGQGTVSIWLWLIPIVIGWLALSPKCDYDRVRNAYDKANRQVFVPDPDDPSAALIPIIPNFGLTISPSSYWEYSNRHIISPDESRIPPVFNYARALPWSRTVYLTSLYYRAAWRKWNRREGFDGQPIPSHVRGAVPPECRQGSRDQIIRYCHPGDAGAKVLRPRGVFFNMMVASFMSLQLQWATSGAAVLAAWYTPTTGLGCRSLAFLIYGGISTMVWMMLVLSNALGYYAHHLMLDSPAPNLESDGKRTPSLRSRVPVSTTQGTGVVYDDSSCIIIPTLGVTAPFDEVEEHAITETNAADARFARTISTVADWLRWIGKSLAIINAIVIIATSMFQYTGVYDNCYCDSSVLSRGDSGFRTVVYSASDVSQATSAWIGALALAWISSAFFVGTIYLLRDSLLA